jgi:hypothetical protein
MATILLTTILIYLIGCEIVDRKAKQVPRKISQYFVNVKTGDSREWPI